MSNETVTYSLEAVLKETKLEIGQAKLTEKVEGMDKRVRC